jgi:polysaccharide deacetylase 2 family uncharacterized protein YibQ
LPGLPRSGSPWSTIRKGGRAVAVASIEDVPAVTGSIPDPTPENGSAPAPGGSDTAVDVAGLPRAPDPDTSAATLIEQSAFGPLPRISPDGRAPRDVYARRAAPIQEGMPRIVLVVSGLGLSQTGTLHAIETLPEDVTLAFAPYGASLQRWVDKARGEGHEVVLQIPLEPAGYPERNPGEHTLLVSADRAGRGQNLHWVLSRMSGYAGVMNHMGGRFSAEDAAMLPFIGEIGHRGLYYLDDGTTPESRAASVGATLKVPVVTGNLVLDRKRSREDIAGQLEVLEQIAAEKGLAVGVASAFPETVDVLADWAQSAGERGFALVPASAALLN